MYAHSTAPSLCRYGLGRGVKRKLSELEEAPLDLPYPQQRQLVLDLCLDKLQSCQRGAEPSLHRSVLLANTLRQIQQEMRLEGGDALPPTSHSLFAPPTPRHIPELPPVPADLPLSGPVSSSSSSSMTLSENGEYHDEGKPPPQALSGDTKSADSLFGMFEITNSTSYLMDLPLDDIFEDIDTSMYDSSEISVLAFSTPREDGVKNLPNLQLCLGDLDHIMDILVRS